MHFYIDEWHDWLRLVLIGFSIYCILVLVSRRRTAGKDWNTKTNDHWYSAFMWQLAGTSFFIQGIFMDRGLTVALIFMTAAVLTAGKALHIRGPWGGSA